MKKFSLDSFFYGLHGVCIFIYVYTGEFTRVEVDNQYDLPRMMELLCFRMNDNSEGASQMLLDVIR